MEIQKWTLVLNTDFEAYRRMNTNQTLTGRFNRQFGVFRPAEVKPSIRVKKRGD